MGDAFYHIVVIAVAAVAVIRGFGHGFTGQVSGVLGFAFGTVCAHVFEPRVEAVMRDWLPGIAHVTGSAFVYSVVSAALVYTVVFVAFRMLTGVLRSAMQVFYLGMLDRLMGSAFCLVKYMLVLSIVYNLILCIWPGSRLLQCARADDGNVVQVVLMVAPGLLGCGSVADLSHLLQLRDAKKISMAVHHPGSPAPCTAVAQHCEPRGCYNL